MARRGKTDVEVTSLTATGNAAYFLRWFAFSKYRMMESFTHQLAHDPDADEFETLKNRFATATKHGNVVLGIRFAVTALLVLAGGSTLVSTIATTVDLVPGAREVILRVAAIASALTLILLVLRLAMDRHLERVTLYLIFIGMQLAGQRKDEEASQRP